MRGRKAVRGSSRRGVVAVEVAVVLPLIVLMLMGLWEVGRLIQVQQLVDNAAREVGRQAAAGWKSQADVKLAATDYLQGSGINTEGLEVHVTNLTNASRSDPSQANQLDAFEVEVILPLENVRLAFIEGLSNATDLRTKVRWHSMKDVPVSVTGAIPVE